ncbi:F-box only protein 30-like [Ixodes scapularis]
MAMRKTKTHLAPNAPATASDIEKSPDGRQQQPTELTFKGPDFTQHHGEFNGCHDHHDSPAGLSWWSWRPVVVASAIISRADAMASALEMIARLLERQVTSPPSGFRRDEYAWHYQNVHRDIHGGLNGWLEQRCPLAQYGCGFSRRRFVPAPRGTEIVHSELLESFGVTFTAQHRRSRSPESRQGAAESSRSLVRSSQGPPMCNGHNEPRRVPRRGRELEFTDFPYEVLQHIAQFLDGFSLNNFSLVSQRCRDVSCSLLKSRGMVVLKWERQAAGWRVGSKRWFFSNAFTPISKWYFSEEDNMSNHLKDCPFFKRNIKTRPHYLLLHSPQRDALVQSQAEGTTADLVLDEQTVDHNYPVSTLVWHAR